MALESFTEIAVAHMQEYTLDLDSELTANIMVRCI